MQSYIEQKNLDERDGQDVENDLSDLICQIYENCDEPEGE